MLYRYLSAIGAFLNNGVHSVAFELIKSDAPGRYLLSSQNVVHQLRDCLMLWPYICKLRWIREYHFKMRFDDIN